MRLAAIAMYVDPQPVADATAALWAYLRDWLKTAGLADVPETLDSSIPYDYAWTEPDLLLSQTCGYPYASRLRGKVRLVATPVYDLPGCDGPQMRSFIIVRADSSAGSLEQLRGARAAINNRESNSGTNLFRVAIAPLSRDGLFFSEVIETGGHARSIEAVAKGRADAAAIDCVTYGNIRRFSPERLAGVRILAETPKGPGLPFITRGTASDSEVALLREALTAAIAEPSLAAVRDTLSLKDFAVLSDADYEPLLNLERQAVSLGYPQLA